MAFIHVAQLNFMRVNAAQINFVFAKAFATIGGVRAETQIRKSTVRITKVNVNTGASQGGLNSATFRMSAGAVTPAAGNDVKIYVGSTAVGSLIFGGTIQKLDQVYELKQGNVAYDVSCVGYAWLLNRRLVTKAYVNQAADVVVKDIITNFSSGYTSTHVQSGMPTINIAFDLTLVTDALGQIANLVAGRYFVDDSKDVWFYTSTDGVASPSPPPKPEDVTGFSATNPISNALALTATTDLSQVRTRDIVKGGGTLPQVAGTAAVATTDTVIPVNNAYAFGGASGKFRVSTPLAVSKDNAAVRTRTDVISYTGRQRGSLVALGQLSGVSVANGAGSNLESGGTYKYGFTFVTSNGETPIIGSLTLVASVGGSSGGITFDDGAGTFASFYTKEATADRPTERTLTKVKIYRTIKGGSQFLDTGLAAGYKLGTTPVNDWTHSISDTNTDLQLGAPAPQGNTAAQGLPLATNGSNAAAGAVTITNVEPVTRFDSAGGYCQIGSALVQYDGYTLTGASPNLHSGTLNLHAALPFQYSSTDNIIPVPVVTGVTGIISPMNGGQALTPFAQVDDSAAQTALGVLEGGDGIQEHSIQDSTLLFQGDMVTLGTADLTLWKTAEKKLHLESLDYKLQPGSTVLVNIGAPTNINQSYLIQRLVISDVEAQIHGVANKNTGYTLPYQFIYPRYSVEGSSVRWTLDDFMWQTKLRADKGGA